MKPQAIVVAGPNGAGKTTFAKEYIQLHPHKYFSADLIAEEMKGSFEEVRLLAGRHFIKIVDAQMEEGESFVIESTISGVSFKRSIERLKSKGFDVIIIFIFLGSADACVARIQERIMKGGHPVPEADVRRRFLRSIRNFWGEYRGLADQWNLYYNGGQEFHEVAVGSGGSREVLDEGLFEQFLTTAEGEAK